MKYMLLCVQVDTKQGPIYAYEVDGLGNALHSFDDPNVPSLLSIPLLGFSAFNHTLYANTRKVILSHANMCVHAYGIALVTRLSKQREPYPRHRVQAYDR